MSDVVDEALQVAKYVVTNTRTFAFTVFCLIPFNTKAFSSHGNYMGHKCIEVKSRLHLKIESDFD
jgi:hypothetical protein